MTPDPDAIARLDAEIAAHGGAEHAVAALAEAEANDLLALLLAGQASLDDRADPALAAARRKIRADILAARAETAWAEGAEFAGRAAARLSRGESALAATFQRRAEAAERLALDLEDQALAMNLEAARIQGMQARRGDLTAGLRGIAA